MRYEILKNGTVDNIIIADRAFVEQHYPGQWRLVAEDIPSPPPPPEWLWLIDLGPFTDRLGPTATMALDTSTDPGLIAMRSDFSRRKWIDLKDQRIAAFIHYLAGQPLPGLVTLTQPLLTAAQATAILTNPVQPAENLALRKLYFGG